MIFKAHELTEKLDDSSTHIVNEMTYKSRWEMHYDFIFTHEGKLYRTDYAVGLTEMQDTWAWDCCDEDEEIECAEVEAYDKVVTAYREVK